jgi:hypothetical protein
MPRAGAAAVPSTLVTFSLRSLTAKEKVARCNLLQVLTAGDNVEDEDQDIGRCRSQR